MNNGLIKPSELLQLEDFPFLNKRQASILLVLLTFQWLLPPG